MPYRTITDYNKHRPKKWPSEWPILTASEIFKGSLYERIDGKKNRNCACLRGWVYNVTSSPEIHSIIENKILTIIENKILKIGYKKYPFIEDLNDSFLSKRQCAALWNEAGRELGYTEI